jgi:hypothetical protein
MSTRTAKTARRAIRKETRRIAHTTLDALRAAPVQKRRDWAFALAPVHFTLGYVGLLALALLLTLGALVALGRLEVKPPEALSTDSSERIPAP